MSNRYDDIQLPSNLGKKIMGGFGGLVLLYFAFHLFFSVGNSEIAALTSVWGNVTFITSPGVYPQFMGHVQKFDKRKMYPFEEAIQFIDGAHATIKGSVQYEVPLDNTLLSKLYSKYASPDAVQKGLIETNIQKAVYLTGQMMTSKESYAEKRSDLLRFIEDQAQNGVYQTRQKQADVPDQLDDKKTRQVTIVEVARDEKTGQILRQESGVLKGYGLNTSNFTMKIVYDPEVEKQIQQQQKLAQDINLSIADAKKAQQRAITVAANGEANAAETKWEQEKINARLVAQAEAQVTIAENQKKAAEFDKQKLILEGEGEAEKKRLIMSADGALSQKLEAWKFAQEKYADAIKNYQGNWVPTVVTGSGQATNGATSILDALGVKALRDLSLDMSVPGSARAAKGGK